MRDSSSSSLGSEPKTMATATRTVSRVLEPEEPAVSLEDMDLIMTADSVSFTAMSW
jgi:hypothetical protein